MRVNSHGQDELTQPCAEWQDLLVLFAAGEELEPASQADLCAHLASCPACSAELDCEKELLALLSDHRSEPDVTLLAGCRAGLEDALDRAEEGKWWRRSFGEMLSSNWFVPSWSGALLVLIGFSVGLFGPQMLHQAPRRPAIIQNRAQAAPPTVTTVEADLNAAANSPSVDPPVSALSHLDLHTADVAGINVFPSASDEPPQVELEMRTQDPVTVQGTVDDDNVKNVLCYVLQNNDRFASDVRLNAAELLRDRHNDPEVRSVLCHAARTDRNAAVRLGALQALDGAIPHKIIRQAILAALANDEDSDVRMEAMNQVRAMEARGEFATGDDQLVSVLRKRMQMDPNPYIRLQSAAAMHDLNLR